MCESEIGGRGSSKKVADAFKDDRAIQRDARRFHRRLRFVDVET